MSNCVERNRKIYARKVYRDSTGRKKQIWRAAESRSEVKRIIREIENELATGTESFENRDSLNEYLDAWLAAAKQKVSPRTYEDYVGLFRLYVRPVLGRKRLSSIRPLDVQEFVNGMVDRGLSPRTVRYTHAVLQRAFKRAIKWKLLITNPAADIELPKNVRREMTVLTPRQAAIFLRQAYKGKHGLLFELALHTGMRPEEYLGLKWSDIDIETGNVIVQRTLVWKRWNNEWYFGEPKTSRSRRSIPLPMHLIKELRAHKVRQAKHRLEIGSAWTNHDLIFCSEVGKPHSIRNLDRRHFKVVLKEAGLPNIRLYDLRHTCATLLLLAGENPKVVSERLGHASIVLTLDTYSHVLPSMQQAATDKLERMLRRR
jgi:integrase